MYLEGCVACVVPAPQRHHLHEVEEHDSGPEERRAELNQRDLEWRPAVKSVCNTAPQYVSALSNDTVSTAGEPPLAAPPDLLTERGHVKHPHGHFSDYRFNVGCEQVHIDKLLIFNMFRLCSVY